MKSKKDLLENSKHFCMAPWVHMSIWQDGSARPCCLSDWRTSFGQFTNKTSINDVFNSEDFRDLRLRMLQDKVIPTCSVCYKQEETGSESYRSYFNEYYAKHIDLIDETQEDGTIEGLPLKFLDIKFSNNCNFRCRMCNPWFSSSIANQMKIRGHYQQGLISAFKFNDVKEELESIAENIEEVYFAGGEPFITDENYYFMDMLAEKGKDPFLRFNSNMSTFTYKGRDVLELLNKFSNVEIHASLDHISEKLEFIRKGSSWKKIQENVERIRKESPHIKIVGSPTLTIYNILDIDEWYPVMNEMFEYVNLGNVAQGPPEVVITSLHEDLKMIAQESIEQIDNHQKESIINFLWSENNYDDNWVKVKHHLYYFDEINRTEWRDIFPEFVGYYDKED